MPIKYTKPLRRTPDMDRPEAITIENLGSTSKQPTAADGTPIIVRTARGKVKRDRGLATEASAKHALCEIDATTAAEIARRARFRKPELLPVLLVDQRGTCFYSGNVWAFWQHAGPGSRAPQNGRLSTGKLAAERDDGYWIGLFQTADDLPAMTAYNAEHAK